MNIVVGIATAGRRAQMPLTLQQLELQIRQPDRIIVCPAGEADLDEAALPAGPTPIQVVHYGKGSSRQRNGILAALAPEVDVVVFFDDDYYPAPDYLQKLERLFQQHPEVVIATNHPLKDGATGPGVPPEEAVAILAAHAAQHPQGLAVDPLRPTYGGYGCNFAIRVAAIRAAGARFDERLPLYGWLEDIDFSRQLAGQGQIVASSALNGVHLAVKSGRTSGLRFGYSQVANPIYMARKGTLSWRYALKHVGKNTAKNLLRTPWPEPWVDRWGRLRGNLVALRDLLTGRMVPERILEL